MADDGVFAGVRVVELAQYVFVPGAGVLLADQGAEVIKVETPGIGDPYRTLRIGDGREVGATNLAMEQNNHSKKSIALDLKQEAGREAFLKLIETADIFLSSLRPRALRALRVDVEDLRERNPKLIYVRGNGLGFRGPEADKPGFDASAFWARGGLCHAFTRPGQQPTSPRPAFGDHIGSLSLAYGMAAALFKRTTTGEPSVVEVSLLSTAAWALSADITYSQDPRYKVHGMQAAQSPLKFGYDTRDGRVIQLMLLDPRPHWAPLCRMLDLEALIDDERFADNEARHRNAPELIALIQDRIGRKDWREWQPVFDAWDAPWELIRTVEDVAVDPQVIANDMIFPLQVGEDRIRLVAGPTAFDGSPTQATPRPAPALGEHTAELMQALGYGAEELAAMHAAVAIQ